MSVLATDSFNRGNNADLGASWDPATDANRSFQILANAAAPTSVVNDAFEQYNAVTWPNDQYVQAKVTVNGTTGGGSGLGVLVRGAVAVPDSSMTCYRLIGDHAASVNFSIDKFVSGTFTNLGTRTQAFSDGDLVYLEVQGTTLVAKVAGSQLGASITDSAIASGKAGISFSSTETSASLDDWEGGDFAAGGPTAAQMAPAFAQQRRAQSLGAVYV